MNKRKIGFFISVLSIVIIGLVFFYSKKNDNININSPHADWNDHYSDFKSMVSSADLVIKGKKVDFYTEQRSDLIFTKQIIEIEKIYKGDADKNSRIEILQTGGKLNDITTSPFAEAPLLDKNSNYLLLLKKSKEGHYLILGGYQGVGLIKNDNVIFNASNTEITEELENKNINYIESVLAGE